MALVVGGPADGRLVQKRNAEEVIEGVRHIYVGVNDEHRFYVPTIYAGVDPIGYLFKKFVAAYPRRVN